MKSKFMIQEAEIRMDKLVCVKFGFFIIRCGHQMPFKSVEVH